MIGRTQVQQSWPPRAVIVSGCTLAGFAILGLLVAFNPILALAAVAGLTGLCLLTLEGRLVSLFLGVISIGLAGYMFFGRGFAYVGLPPLYFSEVMLSIAVLALLYSFKLRYLTPLHFLICLFVGLGLLRTLPYVASYGLDAFRDGVIWGYAIFSIALSMTVSPRMFGKITSGYARLIPYFLIWLPLIAALDLLRIVPLWPGTTVPLAAFKQGDMAVHLAAITIFVVSGLYYFQPRGLRLPGLLFWSLVVAGFAFIALSRAGMLTVISGIGVAFLLWPNRQFFTFAAVIAIVFAFVLVINPNVGIGRSSRQIGPNQILSNVTSIVSGGGDASLQGTKEWRQRWWDEIWGYTVHGPYFLTGKGFGINLAEDDGFQVLSDNSLRSPHNGHVTILARMGVPGLTLWIIIQVWFGLSLFRALLTARRGGNLYWAQVDSWILVCWIAMLLNMSFDVYLEGPQGGIWFWAAIGLGLAAIRIQREVGAVDQPSSHLAFRTNREWPSSIAATTGDRT